MVALRNIGALGVAMLGMLSPMADAKSSTTDVSDPSEAGNAVRSFTLQYGATSSDDSDTYPTATSDDSDSYPTATSDDSDSYPTATSDDSGSYPTSTPDTTDSDSYPTSTLDSTGYMTTPADSSAIPTMTTSYTWGSNATTTGGAYPTGGSDSGTPLTGACSEEGIWNCLGGSSFQRCASGRWSVVQPMPAGTKCQLGQSQGLWGRNRFSRRWMLMHAGQI